MPQPRASAEWDASIEKLGTALWRAWVVFVSVFGQMSMLMWLFDGDQTTSEVVIRDRATGDEVSRGRADEFRVGILDEIQHDLTRMTKDEVLAKWRNGGNWMRTLMGQKS